MTRHDAVKIAAGPGQKKRTASAAEHYHGVEHALLEY